MIISDFDYIYIFTTILVFTILFIMVVVYIFFHRKKSELLLEKQIKEAQFQQELTLAIIEMKETTLSYIGQELHDDLGQKMSVVKLMLNNVLENSDGAQKEILLEINEIIGESIRDIRNLSKSFITEQVTNSGLVDSITKEVLRIDRLHLMKINFEHNTDKVDIQSKDCLILFRIVQECINNVLKHSRAKNMEISLNDLGNSIKIILKDDGVGFDNIDKFKGSGLLSMKKRAELINTFLEISSEKNKGTTTTILFNKI